MDTQQSTGQRRNVGETTAGTFSEPITDLGELRRPPEQYRAWAEGADDRDLAGYDAAGVPPYDAATQPLLHEAWMCGYRDRALPEPRDGGDD
ncbi:hypothetical protein H0B56_12280 [Haloechinothrix sp. YIM 98757]|uniref:Uncharacterized protein n=1 Tax=Haloechinothrix aidingensis TaxID=2752311 RepID=A0A838AAQ1_9PSEU|nr:hypothetical protein [Haloechinothrix aidingensis]MBA0126320.1 hypothetical protein [Haloechinothrix aidingensis]